MIAKQFLVTGMIWAIIGGLFSVVFRLQLGYPDSTFPWLEDLLGHWAKGGKLQPEFYYALVTMHGTILVFFVLTAGLSGTFANFLIPLQVGARDMASPFLNMLSYWFFFTSSVIMFSSLFALVQEKFARMGIFFFRKSSPRGAVAAMRPSRRGDTKRLSPLA